MVLNVKGDWNKRDAFDDDYFFEYPFHKLDVSLLKRAVEEIILIESKIIRDMTDETQKV